MVKTDLVILTSTRNRYLYAMQARMVDSFLKNSPNDCQMIILENNSDLVFREKWRRYVLNRNGKYKYLDKPFNMNAFYNIGTKMSRAELICYCNSDLIFRSGWWKNLVKWFRVYPDLVCACPYTGCDSVWQKQASRDDPLYRRGKRSRDEFVFTHNLAGWFYCLKRNFVIKEMSGFDESFIGHFQDNDLFEYLKRRNYRAGISLSSRVDHLVGETFKYLEVGGEERKRFTSGGTYFARKWR